MNNHYNCVYMYVNKLNNKKYIGQATNFKRRHLKHISSSYNNKDDYHYNVPFHCAIRKYGIENFDIIILKENIKTQCLLNLFECYYIKKYNTLTNNKKGYNVASGGHNGNAFAGKTEEEMTEIKRKISTSRIGKYVGENSPKYGKHPSEETREKMSKAKKGKYCGENNPNYGNRKIVEQWDENNTHIIRIWDNIEDIMLEYNVSKTIICNVCKFWSMNCNKEEWFKTHKNRPSKTSKGFIWKYHEED